MLQAKSLIITADRSNSFTNENGASYHSIHGAITESNHVFIKAGVEFYKNQTVKNTISILEIGFGTGLNALLTCLYAQKNTIKIDYTTLEPHPLNDEIISSLNYGNLLDAQNDYEAIHACDWEKGFLINDYFELEKRKQTLQDLQIKSCVDIVFFDAFAPNEQPELWTVEIFEKLYKVLKNNGLLVTYCSKGVVKRSLKAAGFIVEPLPGPPKKREMIRAIKN